VCATSATTLAVRVSTWQGDRLPEPGRDHVQYLADPPTDGWQDATLIAVASGSCPDGHPAWRLEVSTNPSGSTHLRVLEPARLAAYPSGGAHWLGLAGPGDPNQPFAGPLADNGLSLAIVGGALRATVTPTTGPPQVLHFPMVAP
jgi:hypothetical protein